VDGFAGHGSVMPWRDTPGEQEAFRICFHLVHQFRHLLVAVMKVEVDAMVADIEQTGGSSTDTNELWTLCPSSAA
jgi:hypothetical protein